MKRVVIGSMVRIVRAGMVIGNMVRIMRTGMVIGTMKRIQPISDMMMNIEIYQKKQNMIWCE